MKGYPIEGVCQLTSPMTIIVCVKNMHASLAHGANATTA